jgi:hypothetical protein
MTPRAIDLIRQRYAAARRALVVPEWGLTLYATPFTTNDLERASVASAPGAPEESVYLRNLRVLVLKATDAEGQPVFTGGDLHYLAHEADLAVVQRVIDWIMAPAIASLEAAKAVVDADPSSPGV